MENNQLNKLYSYQNGNCTVEIFEDGTKTREWVDNEMPAPLFPESIDMKITNRCGGPNGTQGPKCKWCHEQSTYKGQHGSTKTILDVIKDLPAGIELAIGGGNPLEHPDIIGILHEIKERGIIANITVNSYHIKQYLDMINYLKREKLIHGLGLSYNKDFEKDILDIADSNTVLHVIAGVHNVWDILKLPKYLKLLVLGYKNYGFGAKYIKNNPVTQNLAAWQYWIGRIISKFHTSFDNLGIKQLNIQDLLSQEAWNEMYMGDDGCFTMYIDAVKEEFSVASTKERVPINGKNIFQMFNEVVNTEDKKVLSLI